MISTFALDELQRAHQKFPLVGNPLKHGAKTIDQAIGSVATAIATRHANTAQLVLVGIANGGIVLASRLVRRLQKAGLRPGLGTIDISFHRDDIDRQPIPKEYAPTVIPPDINDAVVILVDDVLFSGRTVKAALDELFDHGRPAAVELAVLVDRGGRRLPIGPDYCGLAIKTTMPEKVVVRLDAGAPANDSIMILPAPGSSAAEPVRQKPKPSDRALAS